MILANGLSILFIFSKNQLVVLLIFAIISFISFSFISDLIFMISFLLLTLGGFVFLSLFALGVRLGCFLRCFLFLLFFFWLCCVFVAAHGLALVAASRGYSLLWCTGFSLRWLLLLWSTSSRHSSFGSYGTQAQ